MLDGKPLPPSSSACPAALDSRSAAQTAAVELERARAAAASARAAVESLRGDEPGGTGGATGGELYPAALSSVLGSGRSSGAAGAAGAEAAGRVSGRGADRSEWGDRERDAAAALERELSMLTREYAQATIGYEGLGMGSRGSAGGGGGRGFGSAGNWPPELLEAAAAGLALPPPHGNRGGRGLPHGGHGAGEAARGTVLGMVR